MINHFGAKDSDELGIRTACVYARTSSPNQRFNYSIGEQIQQCLKYCEQREWEVTHIFIDECISGGTIDRPKFQIMLEKAKINYFDIIVTWRTDRFCRSLVDLINIERKLREWNVHLCSVTEVVDTGSSIGRFNFRNLASFAELEREIIGDRARLGLHALARKHKWPNSYPPLGYDIDTDGKLKLNQEEVQLVRRIFSKYIEKRSMPQLAYDLNKCGILTKQGNKWNAQAVQKILTNEIYIGIYDVAGYRDYVEEYRILDDDTFELVTVTRNRYKRVGNIKEAVPQDRRYKTIDTVFKMYDSFLRNAAETEAPISEY